MSEDDELYAIFLANHELTGIRIRAENAAIPDSPYAVLQRQYFSPIMLSPRHYAELENPGVIKRARQIVDEVLAARLSTPPEAIE